MHTHTHASERVNTLQSSRTTEANEILMKKQNYDNTENKEKER